MTLLEVVAGLVILGTILASLAIARGRFARQWAAADRKMAATKALDEMIGGWMSQTPPSIPINRQGPLPEVKNCVWRTRASRGAGNSKLGAEVVRVEVFDRAEGAPLVSVDLLVHAPPKRAATMPAASLGGP